jgi:signal transduction histidine kinase
LAIHNFRLARNIAKRNQLEEKYAELKNDVTLPTSTIEYSTDHIAHLKEREEEIKNPITDMKF